MGLYRFTGGTADFSKGSLNIGSDGGKGTLEVGAGTGTFTAKSMNLAGAGATLKFKLGADGSLATLGVTGALTIGSGAKLEVDASECTDGANVTLMTFGSRTGEFASGDIEVLSASERMICNVQQLDNKIRFVMKKLGFMVIVR